MKVRELFEWSKTDPTIKKELQAKGYEYLGKGADQTAYLDPSAEYTVFKVFGTAKTKQNVDAKGFTQSHKMFKFWYEYCEKNKSNQFLPKIYGYESFKRGNDVYLQIRMEQLQKLPASLAELLEQMADEAGYVARGEYSKNDAKTALYRAFLSQVGRDGSKKHNPNAPSWSNEDNDAFDPDIHEALNELTLLLGKDGLKELWRTLVTLAKFGYKNNWTNDLHSGNFMHRNDGIPVIVDPWVI